jgi:sugar O-acyltransferase (sialic acid O-acetyltransferase NeuD family)
MAKVVIFGVKDFASLAHYYLRHDSPHQVVGFTVHQDFMPAEPSFEGLPVVPFEGLAGHFPPEEVSGFAPLSHKGMNSIRERVYREFKERGYPLISYVSSRATCLNEGAIGENCFILEDNTIQPFVTIGNNVVLWSGNHIGHHSQIKDHVFITSHVVVSGHCVIDSHCFLGVNATLRDQIHLGQGTLVGMGAAILRSTEPWSVHKAEAAKVAKVSSKDLDF